MVKDCGTCNGYYYKNIDLSSSNCPCCLYYWSEMEDCRENNYYRWHKDRWHIPERIKQ